MAIAGRVEPEQQQAKVFILQDLFWWQGVLYTRLRLRLQESEVTLCCRYIIGELLLPDRPNE